MGVEALDKGGLAGAGHADGDDHDWLFLAFCCI